MKSLPGKTIWQSETFPGLRMTDTMLTVFRRAYKRIRHFEPEMLKMEAWLVTHPDRVPKSRWGAFINAWMRKADFYISQKGAEAPGADREAHKSVPKQIGDLFTEIAEKAKKEEEEKLAENTVEHLKKGELIESGHT